MAITDSKEFLALALGEPNQAGKLKITLALAAEYEGAGLGKINHKFNDGKLFEFEINPEVLPLIEMVKKWYDIGWDDGFDAAYDDLD